MMETSVATMTVPLVNSSGISVNATTAVATETVCMDNHNSSAIATVSMSSHQSSELVSTVLPPDDFSLVDLGLDKLQVDQLQSQPKQLQGEDNFDELVDIDEGVNLVVKATYWWCKDCNIKQKFGCGESMDAHLRLKHKINKLEEGKDLGVNENPFVEPCTQVQVQEAPVSDVITSVYAIPSDTVTVQDQAVDTLIVFDDATTLQVVTKPPQDSCLYSSSPKTPGNKMNVASKTSLTIPCSIPSSLVVSGPSEFMRPTDGSELPHFKPIPVIPALPPANPLSVSSSASVTVKASEPAGSLTLHHASDGDGHGHRSIAATATQSLHTNLTQEKHHQASVRKSSRLKGRASHAVTRRQMHQTTAEDSDVVKLPKCSVQVKRLSRQEVKRVKAEKNSASMKLRTKRLSAREVKWLKGKQKSVSMMKSKAMKNLSKQLPVRSNKAGSSHRQHASGHSATVKYRQSSSQQQSSKHGVDVNSEVVDDVSITCADPKVITRRSSGRKIKKPVRYITGSESEDDHMSGEPQPLDDDTSQGTSSSAVPKLQQTSSEKLACKHKKCKITVAEAQPEPKQNAADAVKISDSNSVSAKKGAREEKYCCEDCGRKFRFESKLNKHIELYQGQRLQQCSVCDMKLHNLDLLNVHIYHVHKTQESTSCLTCGNSLGSKRSLLNHLLTHPNAKGQTAANLIKDSCATHQCSICDESIIEGEGRVEKHYMMHNKSNAHNCQKCRQSFRHKSDLYSHLKEHGESHEVLLQSVHRGQTEQESQKSSLEPQAQPVQDIISQSVQQILKFEENSPQSLSNQITVTFIPHGFEEAEAVQAQTPAYNQSARPLLSCQSCGKQFRSKKLLYQHLKVHQGADSAASNTVVNDSASQAPGEEEPACQPIDLAAGVPFGIPCSLVKLEGLQGFEDYVVRSFTTTPEGLVVPNQMHYTCALCERAFESENQARRHVNRFGNQQTIVQCNQCECKFHNLDLFNVHYAYIHQPEGIATCMTCSVEFKNKSDFITHLGNSPEAHPLSLSLGFKTFIRDACGTTTCSMCQKRMWNYPMNIANHIKMHKSFSCPVCQQMFPYKYALLIHLQAHTNSRNLNLVSELSERELEQSELAELVDKLHNIIAEVESVEFVENQEKFQCSLCDGEIWHQRKNIHKHLDLHARKVLQNIREGRYFCPDCGEDIAVTEQSVSDHMSSHGHTAVQFVCVFCSQTFTSFDEFKDHELKKHWLNMYFEKSMCDVCGKELVSRYELKKHVKLHEEKQGLFSCPRCKQTFRFEVCVNCNMCVCVNLFTSFFHNECDSLSFCCISSDFCLQCHVMYNI